MKGKPKVRKSKVDAGNPLFRYLREMGIGGPQLIAGHNPATKEDREEMREKLREAAVTPVAPSKRRELPAKVRQELGERLRAAAVSGHDPGRDAAVSGTPTERGGQPISEEYETLAEMEQRRRRRE